MEQTLCWPIKVIQNYLLTTSLRQELKHLNQELKISLQGFLCCQLSLPFTI